MTDVVMFLFGLIVVPLSYVLSGWALSILWEWFIVPLGIPPVTIPSAIGIAVVVGYLTKQMATKQCRDNRSRDEKREDSLTTLIALIIGPLMSLLVGWIAYQFVG